MTETPPTPDKPAGAAASAPKETAPIGKWIGLGVGAGIGSAAIAAALLYANRSRKKGS